MSLITGLLFFIASLAPAAEVDQYVHLYIVPRTFQDVSPRFDRDLRLPAPVVIAKTKFHAAIDLYYVPGRLDLPAFIQGRYNVRRENHQWVEVESGLRAVHYVAPATFEATKRSAEAVSNDQFRRKGRKADYTEPTFGPASYIATAMEGSFNLRQGLAAAVEHVRTTRLQIGKDLNVALSPALWAGATEPQPVQFRILHEELNYGDRAQTIQFRRRFEGEATFMPLTAETRALLEQLLRMSFGCGRDGLGTAQ